MTGNPAEAVIVGAGPAGASAAYYLASRGRSVVLLDRSRFPRDKSCGDAVTYLGVGVLAVMGVLPLLTGAWRTRGLKVSMRGHQTRTFNSGAQPGETGLVVPRAILDAAIVARAVTAGARLREGVRVRRLLRDDTGLCSGVETDAGERLAAHVVVAADGATSLLARQAGLCGTAPGGLGYALRDIALTSPTSRITLSSVVASACCWRRARSNGWLTKPGPLLPACRTAQPGDRWTRYRSTFSRLRLARTSTFCNNCLRRCSTGVSWLSAFISRFRTWPARA